MDMVGLIIPNLVTVIVACVSIYYSNKTAKESSRITKQSIAFEAKCQAYGQFVTSAYGFIHNQSDLLQLTNNYALMVLYCPLEIELEAGRIMADLLKATQSGDLTLLSDASASLLVLTGSLKKELAIK